MHINSSLAVAWEPNYFVLRLHTLRWHFCMGLACFPLSQLILNFYWAQICIWNIISIVGAESSSNYRQLAGWSHIIILKITKLRVHAVHKDKQIASASYAKINCCMVVCASMQIQHCMIPKHEGINITLWEFAVFKTLHKCVNTFNKCCSMEQYQNKQ